MKFDTFPEGKVLSGDVLYVGSVFLYHYFLGVADEKFADGLRQGAVVQ